MAVATDYPFPVVFASGGVCYSGTPALLQLLGEPALRWSPLTSAAWRDGVPPWLRDEPWTGEADAITAGGSRRFQIASAPAARGLAWQFVEESAAARRDRWIVEAVHALPDAFSITTAQLEKPGPQFIFVNRAFTQLTGRTSEEIMGETPRVLQGARTDRAELTRLVACLASDEPFSGGAVNYRKSGEAFWNEWNITAVRDAQGVPQYYVSMMRDVTADRVARHRVQAAATEWASIIDALDTHIVLTHENGNIARCNRAFADLVGRSFVELVGASLATVLFGPGVPSLPAAMFESGPTTIRLDRCGGWFAVDGRPTSRNGRVVGWVHTLVNVTPSQQTAEQLRRLAAAAEQAHDGIAVLDIHARIQYANPRLAALLACERGELLHQGVAHAGVLPDPNACLERARAVGAHTVEHELVARDGRRSAIEIAIGRVGGVDGELDGYVLIVRDRTERQRLWRIAEHASALGNIGHWLGGLRHELGNPVNSVKVALKVLHTHLPTLSTDDAMQLIARATSELGRIEFLLRTLKTFSLYENLESEIVAVLPFFQGVAQLFEPDLRQVGIELSISADRSTAVRCDRRALHQILINLVSNAMDASAPGHGRIALEAEASDHRTRIAVRDNGVGMSDHHLARAFEPFETTKPHGTGLGLVLVRRLVVAMGGQIEIASTLGHGTIVSISFPNGRPPTHDPIIA